MWHLINTIQKLLIVFWTVSCGTIAFLVLFFTRRHDWTLFVPKYLWSPVLFKIALSKVEIIPNPNLNLSKPRIWIANHQSNADIPIVFIAIPVGFYFIAKKELKYVPFIGWFLQAIGIFIDRSDNEKAMNSMREAGEMIKRNRNVLCYPEGTRSIDGQVNRFKRGAFIIAIESDIEIVPVAIKGTREIWAAGSSKIRPATAVVKIGQPISAQHLGYKIDEVDKFSEQVRNELRKMLDEM